MSSRTGFVALVLLLGSPVWAQESASFKQNEHAFNAGGRPDQGNTASSASFTLTFDSVGGSVGKLGLVSASYKMGSGFVAPYLPTGEVGGLVFSDSQTLEWDPEPSSGIYNLYRDLISSVTDLGYGSCEQLDLANEHAVDPDLPPDGDGYFYLVTAENLLAEEGTKGFASNAAERANPAPCP